MSYTLKITITLKPGILNPEAHAIRHALTNLGFRTEDLRTARIFLITIDTPDEGEARAQAEKMCERLLANPVIHDHTVEVMG